MVKFEDIKKNHFYKINNFKEDGEKKFNVISVCYKKDSNDAWFNDIVVIRNDWNDGLFKGWTITKRNLNRDFTITKEILPEDYPEYFI